MNYSTTCSQDAELIYFGFTVTQFKKININSLCAAFHLMTIFSCQFKSTGGLIGQEWKGKESDIINGIIVIGTGHFFVIIAGILAVFAYAVE
jgi:hypothetical protein